MSVAVQARAGACGGVSSEGRWACQGMSEESGDAAGTWAKGMARP